jgi:ankyrin repeat protein
MLLRTKTEMAYQRNLKHLSPLHVAAHYGSTDAIKALLRHCPDVAEMVDSYGRNAFHASVISGKVSALKCLLRHVRPAELLNRVDAGGETPLPR